MFEGSQMNLDDSLVDVNLGLTGNDNTIEDMHENDALQEEISTNAIKKDME